MVFESVIGLLETMGLFNFVLPFILVFAIMWSILRITKILGDPKDAGAANAVVSVVIALFVAYFARVYDLGTFFSFFLSRGTIFIIIFVLATVIANFLDAAVVDKMFKDVLKPEQKLLVKGILFFVAIGIVFGVLSSTPFVGPILGFEGETAAFGMDLLVSVLVLVLLGGLLYMIMGV